MLRVKIIHNLITEKHLHHMFFPAEGSGKKKREVRGNMGMSGITQWQAHF